MSNNTDSMDLTTSSPGMLKIAKERGCYEEVKVVDLNKSPLPYASNDFDAVCLVGALTYINPKSGVLKEFVRITSPEGFICYTNRTDKLDAWKEAEEALENNGSWRKVTEVGPIPYLPLNEEYGKGIDVVIKLYQVCEQNTIALEQ
jgi:ubiquinone/menaquinone biosynthesis C-methylase UbiE